MYFLVILFANEKEYYKTKIDNEKKEANFFGLMKQPHYENVVSNKGTTLHSKGKMVWWTKSKDASATKA